MFHQQKNKTQKNQTADVTIKEQLTLHLVTTFHISQKLVAQYFVMVKLKYYVRTFFGKFDSPFSSFYKDRVCLIYLPKYFPLFQASNLQLLF